MRNSHIDQYLLFASPQNSYSFVHLYSNLKFTLHSDNKGHVHKNKFGFPPARPWAPSPVRSEYFTLWTPER